MSDQNKPPQSEIVNELNRLGENLSNLLTALWNSNERHHVENELRAGLEQLNKKLDSTAEQLKKNENLQKAKDNAQTAARDAWQAANGPQILTDVRKGITDSLRKVNEELAKRSTPAPAESEKPSEPPQQ